MYQFDSLVAVVVLVVDERGVDHGLEHASDDVGDVDHFPTEIVIHHRNVVEQTMGEHLDGLDFGRQLPLLFLAVALGTVPLHFLTNVFERLVTTVDTHGVWLL